jgi:hypothetical protein
VVLVQTTELANVQAFSRPRSPLTDSNRRPLLTMFWLVFAVFGPFICYRLPLVAPARLHKRSIRSAQIRDEKTDLGGLESRRNA